MPESSDLPNVLQFMQLLWAVVHGMEQRSKWMNREIGVTGPQRLVLRVVGLFPGVSAGDVAAVLHVHPSTLTGILHRLVEQRLLLRVEDASDRRRALFHLTARGARSNAIRAGTVEAAIATTLRTASPSDQAATRRLLERLAEQLAAAAQPSPRRRRA